MFCLSGTHYAYFESSPRNDLNDELYYDDLKDDADKTESFFMSNVPAKYKCLGFYHHSFAEPATDNTNGLMGYLKVTEDSTEILNVARVDQNWNLVLYNITASSPFTVSSSLFIIAI